MPTLKTDLEKRLWYALKRITLYQNPEQLRRRCKSDYGLDFEEALEMTYENVLTEAKTAIQGVRVPPKTKSAGDPA